MRRLTMIAGLAACGSDGPPPVGPIEATVTHYGYAFDVETRAAHSTITATVDVEGDCLTLPFRAEGLDPGTAKIDGRPIPRVGVEGELLTACGDGHDGGATLVLEVDHAIPLQTWSTSQVGYSITQDRDGNPFYYLVSWVGGCDRFGPCDNRPDRFATYTFDVTHPASLQVACPGTITELSETETRCDFAHAGGPTYSTFGVAAYPAAAWMPTDLGTWGPARVTIYDRPGNGFAAALDPAHHAGFIGWMEARFGPYPFGDELRILTAPTYWNGFEHPGNIVLDDGLHKVVRPSYLHNAQHILDHELAHQWAGDQTTLAGTYDFVWKEAMAEYLTFAYEDSVEPAAALATAGAWKGFAVGAAYFPVPDERPPLFDYYGDVYGAGPMILFRQLEALTSREQILAALAMVLGQPRAISVDDVLAALEASTGLDLEAYAAAWIRGAGAPEWPRVDVTYTPGATDGTLRVAIANPGGAARRCKFHVGLRGANAGEVVRFPIDTFRDGPDQTLTVPTPAFAVTGTEVDPLRECLVYVGTISRATTPRTHPWRSERGRARARDAR